MNFMALTPRLRAVAEDGCFELIKIDQDGGVLRLDLDGSEIELPNGYVTTEVYDDKVYVSVMAWYCADRVELTGTPSEPPEDDDDEENPAR
jgi:hypothetical protein